MVDEYIVENRFLSTNFSTKITLFLLLVLLVVDLVVVFEKFSDYSDSLSSTLAIVSADVRCD